MRIRALEFRLLDLFKEGRLAGTVHTCIGQEFCAAASTPTCGRAWTPSSPPTAAMDITWPHGGPEDAALGGADGPRGRSVPGPRRARRTCCHGRFFSAGSRGQRRRSPPATPWPCAGAARTRIAVVQIGDGTLGRGDPLRGVHLRRLAGGPVLFLLEYNGWAQSTDVRTTTPRGHPPAGRRLRPRGPLDRATTTPRRCATISGHVVERVRGGTPFLQVIETRRLMAHSKGDDNRPQELVAALWRADPLAPARARTEARAPRAAGRRGGDRRTRPRSSGRARAAVTRTPRPAHRRGAPAPARRLHADAGGPRDFGPRRRGVEPALHEVMGGARRRSS